MRDQLIPLDRHYDADKLLEIYNELPKAHQIIVTGKDASTPTPVTPYADKDSDDHGVLLNIFKDSYLEDVYNDIAKDYTIGKTRFWTMDRSRRAYSYHTDFTKRLHIPLATNDNAFFILEDYQTEHMPVLGQLYELDTTRLHSAVNLSQDDNPRIHLVFGII